MKRILKNTLILLSLALVSALLLAGCMDRRDDDGGAGAGGANPGSVTGTETNADAGTETKKDAETDAGTEPDAGTETDAETDAETDTGKDETGGSATEPGKSDGDKVEEISTERKLAIIEAYAKAYPQSGGIASISYCGDYKNATAVLIYGKNTSYTQALWNEEVDGVTFRYNDGNYIVVFDGTKFHRLSEAFEKGLLTHDDLAEIASRLPGRNTPVEEK